MSLIATLITNPRHPVLDDTLAATAAGAVRGLSVNWLAPGIAFDVVLPDDAGIEDAQARLDDLLKTRPVDIIVQSEAGRRKKILIADMDSTMIQQECIDELAAEAGLKEKVSAITARAMNGEIAFEPALRERVGLLKGLPVSVIRKVLSERITLMSGGRELVQTMASNGAHAALVSGGFTHFTAAIAKQLGFHENRANTLIEEDGVLTGTVGEPILGKQAKVDALLDISARLDIPVEDAIAVGDGANDLGMLQLAGSGVALHAKPSVAAQARMKVEHGDLTALLYIQGYRNEEFVQ